MVRMSLGCHRCHTDTNDCCKDVTDKLQIIYGSYVTDELQISITDKIRKGFTKKSSSLIFHWRPHGHIASMADATRTFNGRVQG